jgi:hypothetical protein
VRIPCSSWHRYLLLLLFETLIDRPTNQPTYGITGKGQDIGYRVRVNYLTCSHYLYYWSIYDQEETFSRLAIAFRRYLLLFHFHVLCLSDCNYYCDPDLGTNSSSSPSHISLGNSILLFSFWLLFVVLANLSMPLSPC